MKPITIVGAGMTGLLARAILRGRATRVIEKQPALPDNHHALLRFRSPIVSNATGIPFKRVKTIKGVLPLKGMQLGVLKSTLAYAHKTTGRVSLRSVITDSSELVDRWIAPQDFVQRLADLPGCPISFNEEWDFAPGPETPAIWTGPLHVAAVAFRLEESLIAKKLCQAHSGWSLTVTLDPHRWDVYASVVAPWSNVPWYRTSVTGNIFVVEGVNRSVPALGLATDTLNSIASDAMSEAFGFELTDSELSTIKSSPLPYAKIVTAKDSWRREIISSLSRLYNVYSLGRFATWRSDVLLDDIVKDIELIQHLIEGDSYNQLRVSAVGARRGESK